MPGEYSPSPYIGLEFAVKIPDDFIGNKINLYGSDKEFNADAIKADLFSDEYVAPHERDSIEETFRPASGNSPGYRRFFDGEEMIPSSYITKYVENLNYSINKHDTNGVRSFNKNNESAFFVKDEEEGDYVSPADLIIQDEFEFSQEDIVWAMSTLPYAVKRLFRKSGDLGIHIFSLLHAYVNVSSGDSDKPVMRKRLCGPDGVKSFITNVTTGEVFLTELDFNGKYYNEKLPVAIDWMRGVIKDSYSEDLSNYLKCCSILSIDIKEEDPMIYSADYIYKTLKSPEFAGGFESDSLPKQELLTSMKKNPEMFEEYSKTVSVTRPKQALVNTMDLMDFLSPSMEEDVESVSNIFTLLHLFSGKGIPVEKVRNEVRPAYKFVGDVLVTLNGYPFIFPLSLISNSNGIGLISKTGHVVQVTSNENSFIYTTVMQALKAVATNDKSYVTWEEKR